MGLGIWLARPALRGMQIFIGLIPSSYFRHRLMGGFFWDLFRCEEIGGSQDEGSGRWCVCAPDTTTEKGHYQNIAPDSPWKF